MTKSIALWAVALTINGSTQTIVNINPDQDFVGALVTVMECSPASTGTVACVEGPPAPIPVAVDCGTAPVKAPLTGPFIRKASSGDCYEYQGANPNGTVFPQPGKYVPCPL